jgi:hypothetical protein
MFGSGGFRLQAEDQQGTKISRTVCGRPAFDSGGFRLQAEDQQGAKITRTLCGLCP